MGELILNSLEIKGFRAFRHLQIERLGRVNLIVGKNNIGKTSLLEALYIYAHRVSPKMIWELMEARDEDIRLYSDVYSELEERVRAYKYLFYGRKEIGSHLDPIQIGPINSLDKTLSVSLGGYATGDENAVPHLVVQLGAQPQPLAVYPIDPSKTYRILKPEIQDIPVSLITANGLDKKQLVNLWDRITLTSSEKVVLDALRIVAPGVEDLNFVGDPSIKVRIPLVKIAGIDKPIPLRSLGDGIQRVLGIAMALVRARDGMVLIDEVENGIHYLVQPELWQLIFQLAHRLNIQVFATTHNWDTLKGFQRAAQEDTEEEGLLIRLSLKQDEISVTLFDERKLGIATREQIEVR